MNLHVVGIRYWNDQKGEDATLRLVDDGLAACREVDGDASYTEAVFPEERRTDDRVTNLGILGGAIADAVAEGATAGKRVVIVGSNCTTLPGILGGLQDAYGPTHKMGLVWFDAHGDFNTPRTTLSGMLGGMPVAVSAGLCFPHWREASHLAAPLPTDRIVMVDVRNLDAAEEQLIRATDVTIAAPAPGFPGEDLQQAIDALAEKCDILYLHIDADILDGRYVPNHRTIEPNGPSMEQVQAAIDTVMNTGKVGVFAVVSIWTDGAGGVTAVESGTQLVRAGVEAWARQTA